MERGINFLFYICRVLLFLCLESSGSLGDFYAFVPEFCKPKRVPSGGGIGAWRVPVRNDGKYGKITNVYFYS